MFVAREITIPGDCRLSGLLTIPQNNNDKKLPAILMVPGAGKVDRDGNVRFLQSNMLRTLSTLLVSHGCITLRYDKRGVGKSTGNYYSAGLSDFIDDGVNAIRYLKTLPAVDTDRIVVLGHSEGAFLAPAICQKEKVNGLILLCGTALSGKQLILSTIKKLIQEIQQASGLKGLLCQLFSLDRLIEYMFKNIKHKALTLNHDVIKILGIKKFNAKWFKESYEFDSRYYLQKIYCPALVIGGEKDIQVDPNDTEKIAALIPSDVENYVIPNMNHILHTYPDRHHLLTCIREYRASLKYGISDDLSKIIVNWLQDQKILPL